MKIFYANITAYSEDAEKYLMSRDDEVIMCTEMHKPLDPAPALNFAASRGRREVHWSPAEQSPLSAAGNRAGSAL